MKIFVLLDRTYKDYSPDYVEDIKAFTSYEKLAEYCAENGFEDRGGWFRHQELHDREIEVYELGVR
jgi:ferritin